MKDDNPDHPEALARHHAASILNGFTLRLALFFIANLGLATALVWWLSPGGFADTGLAQSWDVLRGVGGDDSWGPMKAALDYLHGAETKPLYSAVFFDQGIKFQYPPSALFGLEAMLAFGEDRVRTFDEMVFQIPPVNDFLGWGFILVTAISTFFLMEAGLRRRAGARASLDAWTGLRFVLVSAMTLTFYPVAKSFTLGQIQLWINSLFALALLLWVLERKAASGVLIGLICLMKPHYGLFAAWGLLNREWRFTLACIVVGATGLIFSVWAYGWANHLDYLRVLSFMSERGESYFANQSVNGLLNRLASLSAPELYNNVSFDAFRFPPYSAWVYWGTLLSSLVILLTGTLRKMSPERRGLAFSIVALSLTLAAPIAWEHHYGVLLPIFAFAAGCLVGDPRKLLALALCYVFVSNYIPLFNQLAETPLNFLQSYMFIGGLLFLMLMHRYLSETQFAYTPATQPQK
ncbi:MULTISPECIES: glycosyltransferase family 87 protein [Rhodomicrobium]|uniref:glycosyltransferase family 87 protein n=1 Tax=Rhodomicrobium TaxID=1068 RepID=UPI0014835A38|nr:MULTISPECIES: glycosyltransferase family 87 protein [Rhodomicrobium]